MKNIIFDLGNVLVDFKPRKYLAELYTDGIIIEKLNKAIFQSHYWLELDRGTIELEDAIMQMCSEYKCIENEIKNVMKNYTNMFTPIEETIEVLKNAKVAGYNIYYLTNFHRFAFDRIADKYEFFKYFDGGIVSSKVRLLKPEKEIYMKLLDKYRLKPEVTLFIDDTLNNIATAIELGLKTIHLKDVLILPLYIKECGVILR